MPFMRGPEGAERMLKLIPTLTDAAEDAAYRRERVLHYDWARRELCTILGLSRAENWNGYVPSLGDADGIINTSPARRGLVGLLQRVQAADEAGA